MKIFGSKKTGEIIAAHEVWGRSDILGEEYVSVTRDHVSTRYALFRIKTADGWRFIQTKSDKKINTLKRLGWEMIKEKDSKDLLL